MANVFFVGDLHAGHRNVHKFRTQFASEQEHFEAMKENYHKVVTKRDKVIFTGDTAFTLERLADVSTWAGDQILVAGNHCTQDLNMRVIAAYFKEVHALLKYKEFWISHAPMHPDELRGKVNIHGHVHHATIPDSRYFNTSLENTGFMPISLDEIRATLKGN